MENQIDEIKYGSLIRAMNERYATWIAEVEIGGCEEARASELADLAVDVALVGVQFAIPIAYSRDMARVTGRTMPPWIGSVHLCGSQVRSRIQRRDPGLGFSGDAFNHFLSVQGEILASVGRRVEAYIQGIARLQKLEQGWCDAAYWFHEGLAEPLDTIAVAKLETAIEVLMEGQSAKRSKARLCQAIRAFYGLNEEDPLGTDASISVKKFVEGIVGARSRVLHGTLSTLTEHFGFTRADVEALSFDLLRRSSLALDQYGSLATPKDNVDSFLGWVDEQRQARAST